MESQPRQGEVDYPFDDELPNGQWLNYRLERRGTALVLFLGHRPIREALPELLARRPDVFQRKPLEVLEYFLCHPNDTIWKERLHSQIWQDKGSDLDTCLGKLRVLLNDPKPGRLMKTLGRGALLFALKFKESKPAPGTMAEETSGSLSEIARASGLCAVPAVHRASSKFSAWTLPLATGYFTGRARFLDELHQALQQRGKVSVCGGGGCGKTQTAIEYCRRFGNEYDDVLWIRASDAVSLFTRFQEIANALGRPSGSDSEVQETVKGWLAEHPRALLVFDNLDNPEIAKPFWPTAAEQPFVIVTSRKQNVSELGRFCHLELKEWGLSEALEFLKLRTERTDLTESERVAADKLSEETGFWPLALEQAAAFIANTDTSFVDYLETYQRVRVTLFRRGDHRPIAGDYNTPVTITWKASMATLPQSAWDLLAAASHLASHSSCFELFTRAPEALSAELQKAVTDPTAPDPFGSLLGKLQQYSLLQMDRESRTFSLHKLLHEVIRADQSPSQQSDWIERWVQVFGQFLPKLPEETVYEESVPYSRGWASFAAFFQRIPKQHPSVLEAAKLAGRYTPHFFERGRWSEAEALAVPTVQILERLLRRDNPDTLGVVSDLAVLYESQGRYIEAESLFQRTLEARGRTLGADHPDTLSSLNDLAALYESQGRYTDAEPLFRRALEVRQQTLGSDHPDTLNTLNGLALLTKVQGRYDEAGPLYQRALEGRQRQLGIDHPDTLTSTSNLGSLYREQGRYVDAEPLYQRTLESRGRVLGIDHPDTLASMNDLANVYQLQGRYPESETLFHRALEARERVLGADHPHTLGSINDLASLYICQGRYGAAEPLFRRALEACDRVLGADHPNTLITVNNLALVYAKQDQYEEAEPLFQRGYEASERVLGPDHPDTLTSMFNLARLHLFRGRYVDAEILSRRVLDAYKRVLGTEHPLTLNAMSNLGLLRQKQGRHEEAECLFEKALKAREAVLGEDHPNTLTSVSNLAMLYEKDGRYAEAESFYERAASATERVLGPDHPDAIEARERLGQLRSRQ